MARREPKKRTADRMAAMVAHYTEAGGEITDDTREVYAERDLWSVEILFCTLCGVWRVTVYDDWVATRFDSAAGYQLATGTRRRGSLKHNFHFGPEPPAVSASVAELARFTSQVLDARPTLEQALRVIREQNACAIQTANFQAYRRQQAREATT